MKRWRKEKMAKKIRFSLEMEQGVEVRSLEELRENFSLERVVFYLINGKLTTWLRDRYANDIADAIEELDTTDAELGKKISAIFDVSYDEEKTVDFEKAAERIRKLSILKEYTTEQKYVDVVENLLSDYIKQGYQWIEREELELEEVQADLKKHFKWKR